MTSKRDPYSAAALARMQALVEEMTEQSDRGVAIVGSAWVEEALYVTLEAFLHPESKAWKRLFEGNGPLATFSAKIDLLHVLGLISEIVRADLHAIREVRNEFAHQIAHKISHAKLGFGSQHIQDKCLALKCVAHERVSDPRDAFIRACAVLNADFEMVRMFSVKLPDAGQVIASIER